MKAQRSDHNFLCQPLARRPAKLSRGFLPLAVLRRLLGPRHVTCSLIVSITYLNSPTTAICRESSVVSIVTFEADGKLMAFCNGPECWNAKSASSEGERTNV